jgi:hypothetical protein
VLPVSLALAVLAVLQGFLEEAAIAASPGILDFPGIRVIAGFLVCPVPVVILGIPDLTDSHGSTHSPLPVPASRSTAPGPLQEQAPVRHGHSILERLIFILHMHTTEPITAGS